MNVIETALRSCRFFFTHNHPDATKQIACLDAAIAELARLRNVPAPTDDAKGTPETDAHISKRLSEGFLMHVDPDFARQLESALTQSREEVARLSDNLAACHDQFKRIYETLPERPTGGYSGVECIDAYFALRATVAALQRDKARYEEVLWTIRNSAGVPVMVTSAEGHSECVHRANAALSTPKPEGTT